MPKDTNLASHVDPQLIKLVGALVADISAMRSEMPNSLDRLYVGDEDEHWFGPFETGWYDMDDGYWIQWPNLGILMDQLAKEVDVKLEKAEKAEGQKARKNPKPKSRRS